jgi:hypothetical protein
MSGLGEEESGWREERKGVSEEVSGWEKRFDLL